MHTAGSEQQEPPSSDLTQILGDVNQGDRTALVRLLSLVYDELHKLAARQMDRERSDHTLQPTALVNEAYMRLLGGENMHWQNRAHFFGAAAEAMRRILVDHARARQALKRGGDQDRVPLDEADDVFERTAIGGDEMIAIDEALKKLADFDAKKRRIVELRFFAGLTVEETAEILDISARTVKREWRFAKAWLYRQMGR